MLRVPLVCRASTGYRVRTNELRICSMPSPASPAPAEPASAEQKSSQLVVSKNIQPGQQAPAGSVEQLISAAQGDGSKAQDTAAPAAAESCGLTPHPSQPGTPAPVSIRYRHGSTCRLVLSCPSCSLSFLVTALSRYVPRTRNSCKPYMIRHGNMSYDEIESDTNIVMIRCEPCSDASLRAMGHKIQNGG